MKKIAINTCYGGFSLSQAATHRWAELNGRKCFFFKLQAFNSEGGDYIPIEDDYNGILLSAFDIENPNNPPDDSVDHSISFHNVDRDNPKLIQVIEELGEAANGRFGKVKIVEIPDDVDWEISDYDGMEEVVEKSRKWS